MTKQCSTEQQDRTKRTHQVEGQNNCWNFHLSDFPKTINHEDFLEDSLEEGFPEEEAFPEEEDFLEVEDSPEVEDIQAAEEYHLEDHQEVDGDCHRYQCHKPIKGN